MSNQAGHSTKRFLIPISIFFVLLVPMIDIAALTVAYAYLLAGAQSAATAAASGGDYSECLTAMVADVSKNVVDGPLAKIIRMHPVAGYKNSGADLYIVASSFKDGKANHIADFNQPVPANIIIDTSVCVYECGVNLVFEVNPLIPCSAIPLLNSTPSIGTPMVITVNAVKAAKLPGGLATQVAK